LRVREDMEQVAMALKLANYRTESIENRLCPPSQLPQP
jgi:hypothetical protein